MAKPYRETSSKQWSFRLRMRGEDIYRTGFKTEHEARKAHDALKLQCKAPGQAAMGGPWKNTLGQALLQYGMSHLPRLKGADQESRRINRFLRLAGLPTLHIKTLAEPPSQSDGKDHAAFWSVTQTFEDGPRTPNSLSAHRRAQSERTQRSDSIRRRLAMSPVAQITAHDLQQLIDATAQEGASASTVRLEHAVLRQFFNHAEQTWNWHFDGGNPATARRLPTVDNARDRVLSNKEWQEIAKSLEETRNPYVPLALMLLLESAMRCSEALVQVIWQDFDDENCLLRLRAAKAGKRSVPLGPGAMDVMYQLRRHALSYGPVQPNGRIFRLTYEALKAAWTRACTRIGLTGVRLHDLRHTSATRFAIELNGNMPLLKLITGHKTDSQLMRYVNIKAEDVSRVLHGRPLDHDSAPAGLRVIRAELVRSLPHSTYAGPHNLPANVIQFGRLRQP